MFGTMPDHDAGKSLTLVVGQTVPDFPRQRHIADVNVAVGFYEHLPDKGFVHRRLTAMRVEVAGSEFHGLAQHHAERHFPDGERVGNADLLTVIADLELKMGVTCVGSDKLRELTSVAGYVAEICNFSVWTHSPYVGASAFAHKGGLHASAIARFPGAYNHIDPDMVGNGARMVVSELAGKASLISKAASLGFDLGDDDEKVQRILDQVKEREARGYSYEVADGSLALLIARSIGEYEPYFTLESFRVIVDDRDMAAGIRSRCGIVSVQMYPAGLIADDRQISEFRLLPLLQQAGDHTVNVIIMRLRKQEKQPVVPDLHHHVAVSQ